MRFTGANQVTNCDFVIFGDFPSLRIFFLFLLRIVLLRPRSMTNHPKFDQPLDSFLFLFLEGPSAFCDNWGHCEHETCNFKLHTVLLVQYLRCQDESAELGHSEWVDVWTNDSHKCRLILEDLRQKARTRVKQRGITIPKDKES